MKLYFAPMEGVTGYLYRNAVWRHFPYVDKFYAPFIQPNRKRVLAPKEERDVLPEHNQGIPLVPQVLTSSGEGFIRAGKALEALGYGEININLGCPSGTVVSKGKGAAMLADTEKLKDFFDEVFSADWNARITVKTRLGMEEGDDFRELLEVFAQFPIAELIIHPRYRKDFYGGSPRMELFEQALSIPGGMPVCYNGNIFTKASYEKLEKQYSGTNVSGFMLGRGLLANPALARELRGGSGLTKEELRQFHDDILESYRQSGFGERNTLFKMKELWNYWGTLFTGGDRELKNVRKAEGYGSYEAAVDALFRTGAMEAWRGYRP